MPIDTQATQGLDRLTALEARMEALEKQLSGGSNANDHERWILGRDDLAQLKTDVARKLANMGYDPSLHPGAANVVDFIDRVQGAMTNQNGINHLRKVIALGRRPGNKSNNALIPHIVESLDHLIVNAKIRDSE